MRKQLPFTKAWAPINKSQGQTLDGLLLDAAVPPFEHGHSYGALAPLYGVSSRRRLACRAPKKFRPNWADSSSSSCSFHTMPIDSARTLTSLASLPPQSGKLARARPLLLCGAFVDKKSSCTLNCGREAQ
eukprot:scaffold60891_cov29-Phaeocystis_antarctica.AAC.1